SLLPLPCPVHLTIRATPAAALFPYTTLFRSRDAGRGREREAGTRTRARRAPSGRRGGPGAVRIILYSGKGGVGKTSLSAATAVRDRKSTRLNSSPPISRMPSSA